MIAQIIAGFVVLVGMQANARSIHPCSPTEPAHPTHMSCLQRDAQGKKIFFSITIERLVSRPNIGCDGDNFYTYETAHIEKSNEKGDTLAKYVIPQKDFKVIYDEDKVRFQSQNPRLNLKRCVMPAPGAFSVGN